MTPSFPLLLLPLSLLFSTYHATTLPATARMPRSALQVVLNCDDACVADGLGTTLIQERCEAGEYDNFCTTADCSCPTSTRKVQLTCQSRACLSNFARKRANVSFSNRNEDFQFVLSYTVRGTIFDKDTKKPGGCKAVVSGSYRPRTTGVDMTNKKLQAVVDAALEAIFLVGRGKKLACVAQIKQAVQRATDTALAMEDVAEMDDTELPESDVTRTATASL